MAAMKLTAGFLGGGLICLLFGSSLVQAQERKPADARDKLTPIYFGTSSCISCHDGTKEKGPLVCRCTEVSEWRKDLHHPQAYNTLKGPWAARIGQLLHIEDVTRDRKCLSCHGVYIADKNLLEQSKEAEFKSEEGVSCVACHGAYKEWVQFHGLPFNRKDWRKLTREEKEKKYGMTDLWTPAKRVEVCASCHVGNAAEGKVVTHDLYAATHPPLPSFEIAAFGERMPRHWELIAQKSEPVRKILQYEGTSLEQTRLAVEGSVAVFRQAMTLLADQAKPGTRLDFASFDCASCHHDLELPSRRQMRDQAGMLGRPPLRPWPSALLKLGFRQAAGARDDAYRDIARSFDEGLGRLHQAAVAQPFGDTAAVASTARALAADADQLLKTLQENKNPYNRDAARRLLLQLASTQFDPDYDSARQTAWAFNIIYKEVQSSPARPAPLPPALGGLDAYLYLPLTPEKEYLSGIEQSLLHMRDYDPAEFYTRLRELTGLVHRELQ